MGINPDSLAFVSRADALMGRLEAAVDRLGDDLDIDVLRSGNVVTLTFENGNRIVVNSQEAAQEMWVAARSGGFHYRWDDVAGAWLDTRSGEDLRAVLTRLIGLEVGVAPALAF